MDKTLHTPEQLEAALKVAASSIVLMRKQIAHMERSRKHPIKLSKLRKLLKHNEDFIKFHTND